MTVLSPQRSARLAGVLYLAIIVLGLFGEMFVRARLVVPGDPAAACCDRYAVHRALAARGVRQERCERYALPDADGGGTDQAYADPSERFQNSYGSPDYSCGEISFQ